MRDVTFLIIHLLTTVSSHTAQGLAGYRHRRVAKFVGYNRSFLPPGWGPFAPDRANYLPANSEEAPYSARSGNSHRLPQLPASGPRAAPCGKLCPEVLPLPMPWQICSQTGPDWQRGSCTGDYHGWLLYWPKRTFAGSRIRKWDVSYVL